MTNWFFGPVAVVSWFFAASVFVFCATYVWQIVLEVGGVRGTSLAIIFTSCAIICCCFGLILSKQDVVPAFLLGAIVTAAWPPIVICSLVLTDIFAADKNAHRSFTTRSYLWYKSLVQGKTNSGRSATVLR